MHPIRAVPREQWLAARQELLAKEKAFTKARDELARERRALPWVKVEEKYVFDGARGQQTLAELFEGRSQLIVYHFMLGEGWGEGCKSCSFVADHMDGAAVHLAQRDVTLIAVSHAPFGEIKAFKQRMGWRFPWVSSHDNRFNFDYHVAFTAADRERGEVDYNYARTPYIMDELPGVSVFYRDDRGDIYHTYSSYARGLDMLVGAYNYLDLVPKGRDEDELAFSMSWVRHHDRYDENYRIDTTQGYGAPGPTCCASD